MYQLNVIRQIFICDYFIMPSTFGIPRKLQQLNKILTDNANALTNFTTVAQTGGGGSIPTNLNQLSTALTNAGNTALLMKKTASETQVEDAQRLSEFLTQWGSVNDNNFAIFKRVAGGVALIQSVRINALLNAYLNTVTGTSIPILVNGNAENTDITPLYRINTQLDSSGASTRYIVEKNASNVINLVPVDDIIEMDQSITSSYPDNMTITPIGPETGLKHPFYFWKDYSIGTRPVSVVAVRNLEKLNEAIDADRNPTTRVTQTRYFAFQHTPNNNHDDADGVLNIETLKDLQDLMINATNGSYKSQNRNGVFFTAPTSSDMIILELTANYTLTTNDKNKLIRYNNTTDCIITIPNNFSLSNGAIIEFYNLSVAGKLVIRKGDVNMVLNSYQDKTSIQTQFSWCKLIKVANNTYDIMSDTAFLVFDPLVVPPGWQNTLSSGNRTASITITLTAPMTANANSTLVDGIIASGGSQTYFTGQPTANQFIKFQFLEAKKIQGFKEFGNFKVQMMIQHIRT
jgi:hypothetical protein